MFMVRVRPAFAMEVQDLTTASPKVVQNESMALQPVVVDDAVDEAAPATTSGSPTHKRAKTSTAAPISVSYIVETPTQRGKFLIQKALALGVPKGWCVCPFFNRKDKSTITGPLCGKLHRGEDVVIDVNGASVPATRCRLIVSRYKFAFSGDCRPSQLLVEHAKDADVLIHEATFEGALVTIWYAPLRLKVLVDGMMGEAKKKDHSTTEEAIDVGIRANAKHIILTHF
ncbi:hypothetical protein DYB32_002096, partial [Aphanomyces invadans]